MFFRTLTVFNGIHLHSVQSFFLHIKPVVVLLNPDEHSSQNARVKVWLVKDQTQCITSESDAYLHHAVRLGFIPI